MEASSKTAGITDWGIGQATLEDVFVRVTEEAELEENPLSELMGA